MIVRLSLMDFIRARRAAIGSIKFQTQERICTIKVVSIFCEIYMVCWCYKDASVFSEKKKFNLVSIPINSSLLPNTKWATLIHFNIGFWWQHTLNFSYPEQVNWLNICMNAFHWNGCGRAAPPCPNQFLLYGLNMDIIFTQKLDKHQRYNLDSNALIHR